MIRLKTAVTTLLTLCVLLCGVAVISYAQSPELADQYWNQAQTAEKSGRYLEAAQLYEKAAEAEKSSPNPRLADLSSELFQAGYRYDSITQLEKALKYYEEALSIDRKLGKEDKVSMLLNNIGRIYFAWSQYDKALNCYEESLVIVRRLGTEASVAIRLNNIGQVYFSWGKYDKALTYYEEALASNRKLGKEANIARDLNNIGQIYFSRGQFDKALKYYEEALVIGWKLKREDNIAAGLNSIGQVYFSWSQYDKALKCYEEALAIDRKLGKEADVARDLNNIGQIYFTRDQYDKALTYYEEALAIGRRLGKEANVARDLNNIGQIYFSWDKYDKALTYYEEALAINRKLGKEANVASGLNNIGQIYFSWDQYDKALNSYEGALAINSTLGKEANVAVDLNNIGEVYYILKQYNNAIKNFNASIELIEKLRKTATGVARRDYLASQISTYSLLISAYLQNNDYANVFAAMETSRAKLFAERLTGSDTFSILPSVLSTQKNLPPDTVIVSFANISWWNNPVALLITKDDITGFELNRNQFLASLPADYLSRAQLFTRQKGLTFGKKPEKQTRKPHDTAADSFDDVVNYYRSMLTDTSSAINRGGWGPGVRTAGKEIRLERMLYDFLLKPLAKHLTGKKRLVIIPDGVLSYLPFETLTDENNAYLVEKYDISYTQSMGVMEILGKRTWPAERKPLLAFGGAVYDEISYAGDMVTNEKQLLDLTKELNDTTRSKRSMGSAFASLGKGTWDNLPGSLSEVEAIAKTVKGAKVVTGRDVTEGRIKQMSASGELADYKAIHFATHGIVVPELPEMSAIILSQLKNQPTGEDGYLRMYKIEELKLKADFVNLSACETGLGKIIGGEGMVGLTQSFLLAGANGLSASLWSVNDVSTPQFMVALYSMVEQKKIGYGAAINEIKRSFIQGKFGEFYKSPYYWAPFVYYGK